MHRILVAEKKWVSERRFLHALNYCMLLPGPEAMQLATYVGWLLNGVRGGVIAGALFVLPGFFAILTLSILYAVYQDTAFIPALFFGLKAAVLAVVLEAVLRIGKRTLAGAAMAAVAFGAFAAVFFFAVPFPLVLVAAAATGLLVGHRWPHHLAGAHGDAPDSAQPLIQDDQADALARERPSARGTLRTTATWLGVWWIPVALLAAALGTAHIFVQQGWFFSQVAILTFGGAYAVLAYVAQRAVEDFGWLQPGEMLDGLGMAETTPGPLIQIVQFVAFLGAYRAATAFDPIVAGILASIVVTWVTFVPSLLFIFVGAPYIERLRRNESLRHALSGITAAVVGVILNLAVWFALHVFWPDVEERAVGPLRMLVPVTLTPDWLALGIAAAAFVALARLKWNALAVLAGATAVGLIVRLAASAAA
jgi:chromate transporter